MMGLLLVVAICVQSVLFVSLGVMAAGLESERLRLLRETRKLEDELRVALESNVGLLRDKHLLCDELQAEIGRNLRAEGRHAAIVERLRELTIEADGEG